MAGKLQAKQQLFVDEYLKDLNGKQAAIRAGYSPKTAEVQASRLLSVAKVREAVQAAMDKRSERTAITQDYVLNGIVEVIDRCRQAEPVRDREGSPTGEYTFEAHAALKGYEMLGKHLKLFTDKHEFKIDNLANLTDEQLLALASRLVTPGSTA
jgi:phage terminase small subunit